MWTRQEGFIDLVQGDLVQPTGAGGLLNLQIKLARIKKTLKWWNKEVFGNIHSNLRNMEEAVALAQAEFEADPSPRNRTEINEHIASYIFLLKMEEDFWRQKMALRWLADGYKNTRFYQSWVKQKRFGCASIKYKRAGVNLRMMQRSKARLDIPALADSDLNLFQQLPPSTQLEDLPNPPDAEEVKQAVFDISGDSTRWPDGFSATFYQACRGTVGPDVVAAVKQFFNGAYLSRSITATSIVLIPKKASRVTWADYRPISLCNVINKVMTKILTARISPFLPRVIFPNQSGFVKGRLLNDNVLLAQEMFYEILRCAPAPNVAIKIDMAKAYDRVQ